MIKVAYKENYVLPLPVNHPFPMKKYELLPQQLIYEGVLEESNFFEPEPISEENILLVHTAEYWEKLKKLKLDQFLLNKKEQTLVPII